MKGGAGHTLMHGTVCIIRVRLMLSWRVLLPMQLLQSRCRMRRRWLLLLLLLLIHPCASSSCAPLASTASAACTHPPPLHLSSSQPQSNSHPHAHCTSQTYYPHSPSTHPLHTSPHPLHTATTSHPNWLRHVTSAAAICALSVQATACSSAATQATLPTRTYALQQPCCRPRPPRSASST